MKPVACRFSNQDSCHVDRSAAEWRPLPIIGISQVNPKLILDHTNTPLILERLTSQSFSNLSPLERGIRGSSPSSIGTSLGAKWVLNSAKDLFQALP